MDKPPIIFNFIDTSYKLGAFCPSKEKDMYNSIRNVTINTGFSAMQIYITGGEKIKQKPNICLEDLRKARKFLKEYNMMYLVIHGSLMYNLAGTAKGRSDPKRGFSLKSTIEALTGELDFGVALGNDKYNGVGVVVHPGSCPNKKEGIEDIASTIVKVFNHETSDTKIIANDLGISVEKLKRKRRIILENAAGEGTKICSTLEEIRDVINLVPKKYRCQIKVCIDTAHSFGMGIYDWGKDGEIDRFYSDFDRIVGLDYLEVFHLNDSLVPLSSKKDRHENLGEGYIFGSQERLFNLGKFILEAKKRNIAMILETPGDYKDDWILMCMLLSESGTPLVEIK